MKCLSIRNPWAWAIIRPDLTHSAHRQQCIDHGIVKDVENRSWTTKVRGRVAIHVSASMTREDYRFAVEFMANIVPQCDLPSFDALRPTLGHIIGTVEVVDSVRRYSSAWYMGDHAHVLARPRPCTPMPYKGRLGYFDIPDDLIPEVAG